MVTHKDLINDPAFQNLRADVSRALDHAIARAVLAGAFYLELSWFTPEGREAHRINGTARSGDLNNPTPTDIANACLGTFFDLGKNDPLCGALKPIGAVRIRSIVRQLASLGFFKAEKAGREFSLTEIGRRFLQDPAWRPSFMPDDLGCLFLATDAGVFVGDVTIRARENRREQERTA